MTEQKQEPVVVLGRWVPIDQADKEITCVQQFRGAGITLRNSDTYWVRDEDGRIYEAAWSEGEDGRDFWWDWEGESPVDPVEFMPHPLDRRWADDYSTEPPDLAAENARLRSAVQAAVDTIQDYLAYEHDGDPWTEDSRAMGEMDINDYARDGRLDFALSLLDRTALNGGDHG